MRHTSRKSQDLRFKRSHAAIIAAMSELLQSHSVDALSITRVTAEAGITRPTFYQHFKDIAEAARAAAIHRLSQAFPYDAETLETSAQDLTEIVATSRAQAQVVLHHLVDSRDFYLRVLEGAGNTALFDALIALLERHVLPGPASAPAMPEQATEQDFRRMAAAGTAWMVIGWLRAEDDPRSASDMADVVSAMALRFWAGAPPPVRDDAECPANVDVKPADP